MKNKFILLFIPMLILLLSCEGIFMTPEPDSTPSNIFEEAWTFADREYSFFEFKNIDWDEVKARYEPLIDDEMTEDSLFQVLSDMLYELRDGHVNLRSPFNFSRNWRWFLDYPENYNPTLLERNYWKEEQEFMGAFTVFDFGDVGYIRYGSFSNSISEGILSNLIERFMAESYKGLIIDLRSNGGGSLSNVDILCSRLVTESTFAGRTRFKNGPGHEDFSAFEDYYIEPSEDTLYTKPIVALFNRSSYSATNNTATYMKAIPSVTLMGDQSGGGGGAPAFTELINGWGIRVSSTQLFDKDGNNVEEGVPMDVNVQLDSAMMLQGKDSMLELALETLRQ